MSENTEKEIVKEIANSVYEDAGTQARQFRYLADRVGGGARNRAHQGHFLSADGVYQGGLAAVGRSEESDVKAFHARI